MSRIGSFNNHMNTGKKRREFIMKRLSFTVITAVLIMIIALSVFSMTARAKSTKGADDYKYYTSHMIMPGESLWSIAEENADNVHYESVQDYIDEICFINGLNNSDLKIGDYILIPYFSNELK